MDSLVRIFKLPVAAIFTIGIAYRWRFKEITLESAFKKYPATAMLATGYVQVWIFDGIRSTFYVLNVKNNAGFAVFGHIGSISLITLKK